MQNDHYIFDIPEDLTSVSCLSSLFPPSVPCLGSHVLLLIRSISQEDHAKIEQELDSGTADEILDRAQSEEPK